ncbi:MAG: hypothetical protein ABI572_03590 [Actinomycetota bacterium]
MLLRVLKVAAWAAVFLACAAVGAFIAASTDPFSPSVDAGPPPQPSTGTDAPGLVTWPAVISSRTWHDVPVGGRCATSWRADLALVVDDAGQVTIEGTATVKGELRCAFPIAQLQSEELKIVGTGRLRGETLVFTISEAGRLPFGSKDYGGLTNTLNFLRFRVPADAGARTTVSFDRPGDAGRGEYGSVNRLRLGDPTTR